MSLCVRCHSGARLGNDTLGSVMPGAVEHSSPSGQRVTLVTLLGCMSQQCPSL